MRASCSHASAARAHSPRLASSRVRARHASIAPKSSRRPFAAAVVSSFDELGRLPLAARSARARPRAGTASPPARPPRRRRRASAAWSDRPRARAHRRSRAAARRDRAALGAALFLRRGECPRQHRARRVDVAEPILRRRRRLGERVEIRLRRLRRPHRLDERRPAAGEREREPPRHAPLVARLREHFRCLRRVAHAPQEQRAELGDVRLVAALLRLGACTPEAARRPSSSIAAASLIAGTSGCSTLSTKPSALCTSPRPSHAKQRRTHLEIGRALLRLRLRVGDGAALLLALLRALERLRLGGDEREQFVDRRFRRRRQAAKVANRLRHAAAAEVRLPAST